MSETTRERFFQTKPADQVLYTTIEVYNAQAGVRRFVTNQHFDKEFRLEEGAPRNAEQLVTFQAVGFSAPEPEITERGAELSIDMNIIGTDAREYLDDVAKAWPPKIDIVWRQHLSGVPFPVAALYLQADSPTISATDMSLSASQVNPFQRRASIVTKEDKYPGMRGQI